VFNLCDTTLRNGVAAACLNRKTHRLVRRRHTFVAASAGGAASARLRNHTLLVTELKLLLTMRKYFPALLFGH